MDESKGQGISSMFKKLIAEAMTLVEGTGMPGKLSKKWDRGSRGADSFRTYTKRATNRARRRAEKQMLQDTPKRMTKGYSHAIWPSNPVYSQGLIDKKKTESIDEGGGSRRSKDMRQGMGLSATVLGRKNATDTDYYQKGLKAGSGIKAADANKDRFHPLHRLGGTVSGREVANDLRHSAKFTHYARDLEISHDREQKRNGMLSRKEDLQQEGGGSRASKPMRQASLMKRQGFEATPARGFGDPDKKAASRDLLNREPYGGDPLAKRMNKHPDDPHTQLANKLWMKKNRAEQSEVTLGSLINEFKDILKGGLADKKRPEDFDQEQLRAGIAIEREHTTSKHIATEIAMDHLSEDPNYYKKLKKMETESADQPAPETFTVHFIDGKQVGGPYKSKQRARRAVDRLDNEYGGYRHHIRDNNGNRRF